MSDVGKTKTTSSHEKSLGLVTTLYNSDLRIVQHAMEADADPILTAGILPPATVLQQFATFFPPETPFSYILLRLHELSRMHNRYHICDLKDQIGIADIIHDVEKLTIHDRIIFCASPGNLKYIGMTRTVKALAKCVADQSGGGLLDIPQIDLDILDQPITADKLYLNRLESAHLSLVLYLWLSYRFTGVFTSRPTAFYVKKIVEERISQVLAMVSSKANNRQQMSRLREKAMLRGLINQVAEDSLSPKDEGSQIALPLQLDNTQDSTHAPQIDVPGGRLVAIAA